MNVAALPYEDIVWACANLCDLLECENQALAEKDMETFRALTENKLALVRVYEEAVTPLSEDPALADALDEEQKQELHDLGLRLHDLVTENANRLNAAIQATRVVMDSIVAAAKTNAGPPVSYNKTGRFGTEAAPEHPPLSIDKTY